MDMKIKSLTNIATTYLQNNCHQTGQTKYLTFFKSKSGLEIAIENDRAGDVKIWFEHFAFCWEYIDGASVSNKKFPGQPYGANQTRNSNLNEKNAPKLKVGNKVLCLSVQDMPALGNILSIY